MALLPDGKCHSKSLTNVERSTSTGDRDPEKIVIIKYRGN